MRRYLKNDDRLNLTPIILYRRQLPVNRLTILISLVYLLLSKTALLSDMTPALKVVIDSLCKEQEKE